MNEHKVDHTSTRVLVSERTAALTAGVLVSLLAACYLLVVGVALLDLSQLYFAGSVSVDTPWEDILPYPLDQVVYWVIATFVKG